jgi:hypothetical protein
MDTVVVTIQNNRQEAVDVEAPTDVPIALLAGQLAREMGWGASAQDYSLLMEDARILRGSETLGAAGVVHGDVLVLAASQPAVQPRAASPAQAAARLVASSGESFALAGGPVTVGRGDAQANLQVEINLSTLDTQKRSSRRHAQIVQRQGRYEVRDLESLNGTFVNGKRLPPGESCPLSDGDLVQFGKGGVALRFHSS